jgi:arabinan endo-1,5-alpha-L-arabinosidase
LIVQVVFSMRFEYSIAGEYSNRIFTTMNQRPQNPVWHGYLADPCVFQANGEWFAIGTGSSLGDDHDQRGWNFPMLRSRDFIHWEYATHALMPVEGLQDTPHWAPEIAERDGKFYMYYSAEGPLTGNTHRLRVAVADAPLGPYRDIGKNIFPDDGFTIDAHPFRDPRDGQWYLFYARDWHQEPIGTGIAVVPLADDMGTPLAPFQTVMRGFADWQVFQFNRPMGIGVVPKWYTIEGPFVVVQDGLYYCFYSGGAWHTPGYGVGVAVAEHPLGPWRDLDSHEGAAVLRTSETVVGPGHNSVVKGPDGRWWIAYHAWNREGTKRQVCLDPIEWTKDGPRVTATVRSADIG